MAIGDKYIVTLRGNFGIISSIENVFAYLALAGSGNAHTLATAFADQLLPVILNAISGNTSFGTVEVINLDTPTDFWTETVSETGAIAGDSMPPFVTATFEYLRADRTVQNGRKAFGTIAEASVMNGFPESSYNAVLDALAGALADTLTDVSTSSEWAPRIWRRPGTYAAGVVLPPGDFYPITDVVFRSISSQNTRKAGRGS